MIDASKLFRKKALARLSTPDELDRVLTVVNLRAWLPLSVLAGLSLAALAWSIFGRIPVTVNGTGVLINPGNVKGVQSLSTGQLVELPVRAGQLIRKGELIGLLNQPELRKQLEQAQDRLAELHEQDRAVAALEEGRLQLEKKATTIETRFIDDDIRKTKEVADEILKSNQTYTDTQRKNLDRTRELTSSLHTQMERHYAEVKALKQEGLMSGKTLLQAQSDYTDSQLRLANIDVQMRELDLKDIQSKENYLRQENRISDLTLKARELEIKEQRLRQELLESRTRRANEISEVRRQIDKLKLELERQTEIRSDYTGRILEIAISQGQMVKQGDRVGTVEVEDPSASLKNLAYFAVKDGKRIEPGMAVRVTPSVVQREREGSILGSVTRCSPFPITRDAAVNIIGNKEIVASLMEEGAVIEIEADLEPDLSAFSGYRWTSAGPPIKLAAGITTTVRVTVEERAPITYLLPILRTWAYGEKDESQKPGRTSAH